MPFETKVGAGIPNWRDKFSTVDLLVLTSFEQVVLYWKYYLPFLKQATWMRRSTVLSLTLQIVFPVWGVKNAPGKCPKWNLNYTFVGKGNICPWTHERDRLFIDPAGLPCFGWVIMAPAAALLWHHNPVQKINFIVLFTL